MGKLSPKIGVSRATYLQDLRTATDGTLVTRKKDTRGDEGVCGAGAMRILIGGADVCGTSVALQPGEPNNCTKLPLPFANSDIAEEEQERI
jgi:hypothetical protein